MVDMTEVDEAWRRLGRAVTKRMDELGIDPDVVQAEGGPKPTKLRELRNGRSDALRNSLRPGLERALRWRPGSIANVLIGGDPEPFDDDPSLPSWVQKHVSQLPALPRNAPYAPVLGGLTRALGQGPGAARNALPMTSDERRTLTNVRNKLVHNSADLSPEELVLLARFIEDEELRTLHVRIDWLPRLEQLEVSSLVNDLALRVEERWVADGFTNESDRLPDYAQPNPLPVEGVVPRLEDFPPQVPSTLIKGHRDVPARGEYGEQNKRSNRGEDPVQLLDEALLGHYVDMFLRALEDGGRSALVQQARQVLGDDDDPGRVITPEIADDLYSKYIAARHTAIQGGSPDAHAATELSAEQREAATARYRRERSEMILFDGHIRTAGVAADPVADAIHRVAPAGYAFGQGEQGDAGGQGPQIDPNEGDE